MSNNCILWLIPARSGSKSIIDKNIKPLRGIPLFAYRYLSACALDFKQKIWLSTDSEHYANIGRSLGLDVPFMRPANLSGDESTSNDVVLHAIKYAQEQDINFEFIGLLEPTSPFIKSSHLKAALQILMKESLSKSIVSTRVSRPNTAFIQDDDNYLTSLYNSIKNTSVISRQQFKNQITPSGGIYISRWESFKIEKSFYTDTTLSFKVDDVAGLEIDEPLDWNLAEFYLKENLVDLQTLCQ